MDLKQRKLSKSEWESIEVPVSADEIEVLNLIMRGFSDVTLKYNKHNSLLTYLKIEKSDEMEDYLYNTYFAGKICELIKKYSASFMNISVNPKTKIKKADMIRLEKNSVATIEASKIVLYEYVLINLIENLLKLKKSNGNWEYYYFTIYKLIICLGDYAFFYCSSLTQVTLTFGLTVIGGNMFNMALKSTNLGSVMVPSTITSIGSYYYIFYFQNNNK
jgi:hypothetical protein